MYNSHLHHSSPWSLEPQLEASLLKLGRNIPITASVSTETPDVLTSGLFTCPFHRLIPVTLLHCSVFHRSDSAHFILPSSHLPCSHLITAKTRLCMMCMCHHTHMQTHTFLIHRCPPSNVHHHLCLLPSPQCCLIRSQSYLLHSQNWVNSDVYPYLSFFLPSDPTSNPFSSLSHHYLLNDGSTLCKEQLIKEKSRSINKLCLGIGGALCGIDWPPSKTSWQFDVTKSKTLIVSITVWLWINGEARWTQFCSRIGQIPCTLEGQVWLCQYRSKT